MSSALVLVGVFVAGDLLYTRVGGALLFHINESRVPGPFLLGLALVGGAASFLSPCSIAIMPAFLTYVVPGGDGARSVLVRGSALVALGIVAFYAANGLLVGTIGAVVYNVLIYLLPIVGLIFLGLGILVLTGRGSILTGVIRWNPAGAYY